MGGHLVVVKNIKKILRYGAAWFAACILFIVIEIPSMAETLWPGESVHSFSLGRHWLLFILATAVIGVIAFAFARHVSDDETPWRSRISGDHWRFAALMLVLGFAGQTLLSFLAGPDHSGDDILLAMRSSLAPITVLALVVVSPFLEEILFQMIIQNGLLVKLGGIGSVFVTALLFTFVHGYGFSLATAALFCSVLSYGTTYYVTKDLRLAILVHGLSNLLSLVVNMLGIA
jgi:membrane protease YdiL (CAAX protease family)